MNCMSPSRKTAVAYWLSVFPVILVMLCAVFIGQDQLHLGRPIAEPIRRFWDGRDLAGRWIGGSDIVGWQILGVRVLTPLDWALGGRSRLVVGVVLAANHPEGIRSNKARPLIKRCNRI